MKKSHRKDVIIARIIFAVILVILIALITLGVKALVKHFGAKQASEPASETQTEDQHDWTYNPIEQDTSAGQEGMGGYLEESESAEPVEGETEGQGQEEVPEENEPSGAMVDNVSYWTTDAVRMRNLPSIESGIITVIPAGTEVVVTMIQDNFARVSYGGATGYVSMDYLSESYVEASEE